MRELLCENMKKACEYETRLYLYMYIGKIVSIENFIHIRVVLAPLISFTLLQIYEILFTIFILIRDHYLVTYLYMHYQI